jgi:hydroxymethylpyrimidine/phosphomethylpyrimidine kinase
VTLALTIAGSDSGGGAGIQADLRTFAAHGLHGASALTAVTAQSPLEVARVAPLEPSLVVAQIEIVARDLPVAAVKTGMLATGAILTAVAEAIARLRLPRLVVDPVLVATSGRRLLEAGAEALYIERLFPLAWVATPNLDEAEALLGRAVRDVEAMRAAARDLQRRGPRAVVVKGGHLAGEPVDVYDDGVRSELIPGPRIDTRHTHGTGCTYSAALAARLALGADPLEAARAAKAYVAEVLRTSRDR